MAGIRTPPVPKALRAFIVETEAAGTPQKARKRLRGEREPFARAIRRALRTQKAAALAIASDPARSERIPTITVVSVTTAAGRGRSQLYGAYSYLLDEIREANQRVEAAAKRTKKTVPKSKKSLEAELRRLRSETKAAVARLASTQLTDLLEKLGPGVRMNEIRVAQVATLKRKLRESELARATLSDINKGWMAELNRRPDSGGVK